jgi:hypothetical protein
MGACADINPATVKWTGGGDIAGAAKKFVSQIEALRQVMNLYCSETPTSSKPINVQAKGVREKIQLIRENSRLHGRGSEETPRRKVGHYARNQMFLVSPP